jgi:hypothetical protein
MQLGAGIPEWYRMYKDSMGLTQRNMVERELDSKPHAKVATEEYGYTVTVLDGLGLDPAHVAYYAELERDGVVESLFPNKPSCQVVASAVSAPSSEHSSCSQQSAASTITTDPSCSSTKAQPPSVERAAAFPASFLQKPEQPSAPAGTGGVRPSKRKKQQQPAVVGGNQATITSALQGLINNVQLLQALLMHPASANQQALPPAEAAAASQLNEILAVATKQSKRVSFVDEVQQHQQLTFASRKPALVQELCELMRQHGIDPINADSGGLHALHQHLRGHLRFCLDTFIGKTAEDGISILTRKGKHMVVLMASVDSGATCILLDYDLVVGMGIEFRETPMQLRLANDTKGRVVGLTEPFWVILAAGTPYEARLLVQGLVVKGVGAVFQILLAKDWSYRLNAVVHPREQVLVYDTTAGHRHSLAIEGHRSSSSARAALSDIYAALEKYEEELAPTAFACCALADDVAVADAAQPCLAAADVDLEIVVKAPLQVTGVEEGVSFGVGNG